jgi:tripartite-type tricarboxylate transporter receptor subunit TctC
MVGAASCAALSITLLGAAGAQSYPQRPVRIVVNVTAGGGVDATARVVAQHLASVFKQPFVVDNRTARAAT